MRPELVLSKLAMNLLFKSGKNSLTLKPGDSVNAKIIKHLGNKQVLLNIRGTFIKAKMASPPTGNTVKLYLKALTPNVIFEILPQKTPVKATFIEIQNVNPEKIFKELFSSLSENSKLQKAFAQPDFPAFLNFLFDNKETQLTIDWHDSNDENDEKKQTKKMRFIFNTPSLKTSVIEFCEYENNLIVNAFFNSKSILTIAEDMKQEFKEETGININFQLMTESDNEKFTKKLFNTKYSENSLDLKI